MSRDTTVITFRQPEVIDDPLSELARDGARRMLAQVLIAEADSFVAVWKDDKNSHRYTRRAPVLLCDSRPTRAKKSHSVA